MSACMDGVNYWTPPAAMATWKINITHPPPLISTGYINHCPVLYDCIHTTFALLDKSLPRSSSSSRELRRFYSISSERDGVHSSHGRRARRPSPRAPARRHRDGDSEDGGGPDVPVAEPQVQGHLPQQQQLRRRVPHRELPRRRVQLQPPRAQVLLQAGLLDQAAPAVPAAGVFL